MFIAKIRWLSRREVFFLKKRSSTLKALLRVESVHIVMKSMMLSGLALEFASERLKNNKEFAIFV